MKILLDTHIFLWFIENNNRLSAPWRIEIENPDNQVYLSVASVWECIIKYQIGRLNFPESPEVYLTKKRKQHLINSLVIDEGSIAYLTNLPLLHKDPFDRLLICQSLQHNLFIMTEDNAILNYPNLQIFCS